MEPSPITDVRLDNLLRLMEQHRAADSTPGWERRFAERAGIHPTYLPQIKARTKGIGPTIARRIELAFRLPAGWMDTPHDPSAPQDEAERIFTMQMLALYRQAPAKARRLIEQMLKEAQS